MSKRPTSYGTFRIHIKRAGAVCGVDVTFNDPERADSQSENGIAKINDDVLQDLLVSENDPQRYGRTLADALFDDRDIYTLFDTAKRWVEAAQERRLRIQLLVDEDLAGDPPPLASLHHVRWELLADPTTPTLPRRLSTSTRFLLSRFVRARSGMQFAAGGKHQLRALIAVSAPSDAETPVDRAGEIKRAEDALKGSGWVRIRRRLLRAFGGKPPINVRIAEGPLTLDRLVGELEERKPDILYLVCHGGFGRAGSKLMLQNDDGAKLFISGNEFAARLSDQTRLPMLVVLASCKSATTEQVGATKATEEALAPLLAEAGVPAIVAMQGNISMGSVEKAMPIFFEKLLAEGQIDYAIGEARNAIRSRDDAWMPALFTRLEDGRLWEAPARASVRERRTKMLRIAALAGLTVGSAAAVKWLVKDPPPSPSDLTITGNVYKSDGTRAAGAKVEIVGGDEREASRSSCSSITEAEQEIVETDDNGRFSIKVCAIDGRAFRVKASTETENKTGDCTASESISCEIYLD